MSLTFFNTTSVGLVVSMGCGAQDCVQCPHKEHDESMDKPDGKVLVVSNEIYVHIIPAAGKGLRHII